jgi:aryl-alcohol dehydrogenase-like predicted oxidoreductase
LTNGGKNGVNRQGVPGATILYFQYFVLLRAKNKIMKTRQLGNSDLMITPVGFGAWAIGGGEWEFGWGPQDDGQAIEAIRRAVELGINWIDTAAVYGLGHSEELVAKACRGLSKKPYLFTKCSMVWDETRHVTRSLDPESIRRECEASLRRLETETIDLYQIHWPLETGIEAAWEMLARLKEEGKVRHIGVSNFNTEQLARISAIAPVTSLQPVYSLVNPSVGAEILPYCRASNIGVIVYSPMGSGLLTGTMTRERISNFPANDWRRRSGYFQEPALTRNLAIAETLKKIGELHGRSAAEIAIAWTLLNPAVTGAIVGGRSASQVEGTVGAAEVILGEADLREIAAVLQGS